MAQMPLTLNTVVRKAYKLLDCNYEDLVHCITVFSQQGIVPRSQNQKLCFSYMVASTLQTQIFSFITLTCREIQNILGWLLLSSFPVVCENPSELLPTQYFISLSLYFWKQYYTLLEMRQNMNQCGRQRWLPCQWWLSPEREVRNEKIEWK